MKCPFKLLKAPYDGGAECDGECAWLVDIWLDYKWTSVCAVVLVDSDTVPRKPLNRVELDG